MMTVVSRRVEDDREYMADILNRGEKLYITVAISDGERTAVGAFPATQDLIEALTRAVKADEAAH